MIGESERGSGDTDSKNCSNHWIGEKRKQNTTYENKKKVKNLEEGVIINGQVF
jgi:hypothetical protein